MDSKDYVSNLLKEIYRVIEEEIKPKDRSEFDRYCAIFLTEFEKVQAFFEYWINSKKE